ncbi:hypothetical protein, conserved [Plasmodium vivax]|uniref:Myosin light chain B n=4 Tax=Plasmodium vivax TaxID=5855 RepID=A5K4K0_PLAVS|nr:hypothetical protein, conserved [Plasmodium vivax]EDL45578.1 hypothetical protein, conserved [Plasmodium vivax]KMZ84058.1 hypothetical protein PVBG_02285 [Plasmodium vivax Brazil I]KMZ93227.1 hypothetical protein PVMG_04973 [Plasmodium vivax Mauritania I]KMZ99720.1 hypothetical protein PVNG_03190 [Plasmodium vivax North Korean]|eukprot:XP_001615305.1 hypothetical protein [Plasmodium vivax Sal-1]
MEILKGSVSKFVHTQKRNPLSYDDDDDDGKPFSSLFRKNRASFYEDLRTEAVLLLEFEKINEIINNIDYLDTLKEKVHNRNLEKIVEPLGICAPREGIPQGSDGEYGDLTYKDKFETLKSKYDDLKKNLDTRIHLELIKAGVFYNQEDIQNVLHMVRKYQGDLKTKKRIINVQNGIIQNVVERNKLSRNKLLVDKRKNEELMKMCRTYYEQSKSAQLRLRKLKHAFLEYKIALESIASCCEKIGGDKIILMDAVKSARAQTDLSIATDILNTKKIQELEMNICYCEHQINSLKDDLDAMLGKLQNEKKEKREVMNQTLRYKEHLAKNNAMLIEALENFRRVMTSVDEHLSREGGRSDFKETFDKSKKKYNDFVRKAAEKNKDLQKMGDKLLLASALSGRELKRHQEYLNRQIKEIRKNEGIVEGGEEEQKGHKNRGKVGDAEKGSHAEEQDKEQPLEGESSSQGAKEIANDAEGKEAKQKGEQPTHVDENLEGRKINQVMELLKKKEIDRLTFEDCVDVIYKANLPLTQSKLNELKAMGEVRKDDLVAFIKTFIMDEDEALQNMITFFEIWDVQKTGYMHKELILLILKQFGDSLTEDEMEYLRG